MSIMTPLLAVLQGVLVIVFVWAGITKLATVERFHRTLGEFGVSAGSSEILARTLPIAEILLGLALLVDPLVSASAAAMVGILGVFSLAIGWNLTRGNRPACNCFGNLSHSPISKITLGRNIVLIAVALTVFYGGLNGRTVGILSVSAQMVDQPQGVLVVVVTLALVTLGLSVFSVVLLREYGKLLHAVRSNEQVVDQGLEPGTPAPDFALPSIDGERITASAIWRSQQSTLLVFLSPLCEPCQDLIADVPNWRQGSVKLVLISQGLAADNGDDLWASVKHPVLIDTERNVSRQYQLHTMPTGILVDMNGFVASAPITGVVGLRRVYESNTWASGEISEGERPTSSARVLV